ncbi:PspC domain-containing protein [Marinilongibacter aquaticus]|uniref:PspC domain-containing protein n=1 Tax=Marinilongibacter aquaticus TaxID=2975157 RepID=UPI0021BD285F|nr:PspC domain-containing protein [Marinilongibacter aquaticus]UBM59437.1 PspC domain-containing protein [Marinilongibacter aquaticus]
MKKRLTRIKNNKTVLGGVTLGLGEYFAVDPVIFRIAFSVLFFTPLPSFIIYLILWIVLPVHEDFGYTEGNYETSDYQTSNFTTMSRHSRNGNVVGGIILIVLGAIFAFRTFFNINLFHYIGQMWPLFLIGLGVWIIVRDRDDNNGPNTKDNFNEPGTGGGEAF